MSSSAITNAIYSTHSRARVAHILPALALAIGCASQERAPATAAEAAGSSAENELQAAETAAATPALPTATGAPEIVEQSTNADPHTCTPDVCRDTSFDVSRLHLDTRPLAAQVGYNATPAADQRGALSGTDLGWTFAHRDKLWVMFGDSWWLDPLNLASLPDDALGQISLTDFPDGDSVDAFVSAHPAASGSPSWHAAGPTMPVILRPGHNAFAPVLAERNGQNIPSGVGFVPMTGFSNGRDDASEGVFAIFFSYEHVPCSAGACNGGFQCDTELGTDSQEWLTPPCLVGAKSTCGAGPGFCQDRGTSIYDPSTEMGRTQAVVVRHDVGVTTANDPVRFKTQPWETQRFFNVSARTVTDFDPHRVGGAGNDYKPALGNTLSRAGVFVWGRPQFGGIGAEGRDAQLYLLWSPMPQPDFTWRPQYFSGIGAEGQPLFSTEELAARPLDLNAETLGDQPEESQDFVGQMSVSWIPSLQRWVMFYGGDAPPMFANAVFRADIAKARRNTEGSLYVRFAEQPWGPWTHPLPLMAAGDSATNTAPVSQYAPGGLLAHNNCQTTDCARYDPAYRIDPSNNNGVLYAPSIIDNWTTANANTTDLYWFVSTWNPYQVILMKTSLTLEP